MSSGSSSRYRSKAIAEHVIAFSVSYQRDNLLARGMGLEHLRDLLTRLGRPLLRQGASLAYGGHWAVSEDNFTYFLLGLVSSEQEENSLGGPDTNFPIGRLYNHISWPSYLSVTPKIEAQWINSCRIVRVTQEDAGFSADETVADSDAGSGPRPLLNAAVTLSAMRRLSMQDRTIAFPETPAERIPPIVARIILGGRTDNYSGFIPGVFEEALVTFEEKRPLYILGGFGGAAQVLSDAILIPEKGRPEDFDMSWHTGRNPNLVTILEASRNFSVPPGTRTTETLLDAVFSFVQQARRDLVGTLRTGLSDAETRELMLTRDPLTAARLVRSGLLSSNEIPPLPA